MQYHHRPDPLHKDSRRPLRGDCHVCTAGEIRIAFSEASGPCLIRTEGNDPELVKGCETVIESIGAGHVFCVLLRDAYPINVLNQIKSCPEVCRIFCATANPLQVMIGSTSQGAGILGVIDGFPPKGVETGADREERRDLLRKIGYKR
jgi:uncharacterized protein